LFVVDHGRMGNKGQVGYPSDVSDEEWAFVVPYLLLCREDACARSEHHKTRSQSCQQDGTLLMSSLREHTAQFKEHFYCCCEGSP
jgi:hypothetical protein